MDTTRNRNPNQEMFAPLVVPAVSAVHELVRRLHYHEETQWLALNLLTKWVRSDLDRQDSSAGRYQRNAAIAALEGAEASYDGLRVALTHADFRRPAGWPPDFAPAVAALLDADAGIFLFDRSRLPEEGATIRENVAVLIEIRDRLKASSAAVRWFATLVGVATICLAPTDPTTSVDEMKSGEESGSIPDLVTLDQMAAAVHRKKRTLQRRNRNGTLPPPLVEGGGGKPALWDWSTVYPWLTEEFGVPLPPRYPANPHVG